MAFDAFLKIDGVPGESTDDKHKDWLEVLSFHWGVSQPASGSSSTAGGRSAERSDHSDFSIVKALDKTSPKLFLQCCNGTHIKEVKMELCRAAGDKQKYMEYKLSDVIISSVRPAAARMAERHCPWKRFRLTTARSSSRTRKPITRRGSRRETSSRTGTSRRTRGNRPWVDEADQVRRAGGGDR